MGTEQVGGTHYRNDEGEAHWDRAERLKLPWCINAATKHLDRCMDKAEFREDVMKAISYLQHALEQLDAGLIVPRNAADPDNPASAEPAEDLTKVRIATRTRRIK